MKGHLTLEGRPRHLHGQCPWSTHLEGEEWWLKVETGHGSKPFLSQRRGGKHRGLYC